MKKFLVFTVVLLSSICKTFACGYSPYGEDIRYSLFLPEYFNYKEFRAFDYNSQMFGFDFEYKNQYESNVYDWYDFTGKKVDINAINQCLNEFTLTDINSNSKNEFLKYLYQNKLKNVIQYLITAKRCEDLNTAFSEDTWERDEKKTNLNQINFLEYLDKAIDKEKDIYIKRKYVFLTIRTAYYAGEDKMISKLFNEYFKYGKKDYLYYWSMYFNCFQNSNAAVDVASVMANSPEKKYAAYFYFHSNFNLQKALKLAKTKEDIANVYAYASVQKINPNLDYLKEIYENSNKSKILSFLLLREINKIEDWVYTPYYTNYLPSIEFANNWYNEDVVSSTNSLRMRSEKDRLYAQQVLNFVNTANLAKVENVILWKSAQIQLLFITNQYDECLTKIKFFEKQYSTEKIFSQIEKLKAICLTANQEYGNAIIKDQVKPIILKYRNDERFLFTVGRELEFKGNISDGLALIALGNNVNNDSRFNDEFNNPNVEWQGNRLKNSGNLKYFYEYFDYLDFVYSANQLQVIINKLNNINDSDFEQEIYKQLIKDKNYLKDLLGTKYLRENRLKEAERTFMSINSKYWDENYNAWERDKFDDYYCFEENPFYDIKYTENFIPHKEKYLVTKLSIIQHLIKYINLSNNTKTEDQDYYYFLVANCYYNMTQYGHSWMMRRFNSSYNYYEEGRNDSYIDEMEYRNCELALQNYVKAYETAKTDKFKALCLKFILALEDKSLSNANNNYHQLLKIDYSIYEKDLSGCENLEDYFKARR